MNWLWRSGAKMDLGWGFCCFACKLERESLGTEDVDEVIPDRRSVRPFGNAEDVLSRIRGLGGYVYLSLSGELWSVLTSHLSLAKGGRLEPMSVRHIQCYNNVQWLYLNRAKASSATATNCLTRLTSCISALSSIPSLTFALSNTSPTLASVARTAFLPSSLTSPSQ